MKAEAVSRAAVGGFAAVGLVAMMIRSLALVRVRGPSMLPTLSEGDWLLAVRLPGKPEPISRLVREWLIRPEVVVVICPAALLGRPSVKRIGAVPGEVRAWGIEESRVELEVPAGHIFVVGDAVDGDGPFVVPPLDSRRYGPCSSAEATARILLRLWPPGHPRLGKAGSGGQHWASGRVPSAARTAAPVTITALHNSGGAEPSAGERCI